MATLLLTAVGTAVGGPIGGAFGAFLGQQVDRSIFGVGSQEGPRLKELSVSTSSYGQPIGRHFGRTRVAGSIIWATELVESSSTDGGKGRPSTTTFSYSANFAVALSSTPIERLGRVWADGSLLRGAAGDLKTDAQLRIYLGNGDDLADPLITADKGPETPAFRDSAYIVFENLQLADFGNRIPALTFEIFTNPDTSVTLDQLVPGLVGDNSDRELPNIRGFSDEGGPLSGNLSVLDRVFPIDCITTPLGLSIGTSTAPVGPLVTISEELAGDDNASVREWRNGRFNSQDNAPLALRYYDEDRDYQPGVQRAIGRRPNGREVLVDLPATLTASGAKAVANHNANRARWNHETVTWRVSEINPSVAPGSLVRLPNRPGIWRVLKWEWFDRGIELELERFAEGPSAQAGGDTGVPTPPLDLQVGQTLLEAFELPAQDGSNPSGSSLFVAASSSAPMWDGAALFAEQGDALIPIGSTGLMRSTIGVLNAPLGASPSLVFESNSSLEVRLLANDIAFVDTDIVGLTNGANRLLVGGEVLQFQHAESLGGGSWQLHGLLRGRAGTEDEALQAHPAQTAVVLLDNGLTDLSNASVQASPFLRIGAMGRGDQEAVFASMRNPGLSRRPPTPVHPRVTIHADGMMEVCWTRRARGHWLWDYEDEIPLVEEAETYMVGYGPIGSPLTAFTANSPRITFSQNERDGLVAQYGPANLWVYQIGTYSRSGALFLSHIQ